MDKKVVIPEYLLEGVRPLKNGFPKKLRLFVFDVETDRGNPYLLIVYDGVKPRYFRVDKKTIAETLFRYLVKRTSTNTTNVLLAHNLQFDLTAVFDIRRGVFGWLKPPLVHVPDSDTFLRETVRMDRPKPRNLVLPNPRSDPDETVLGHILGCVNIYPQSTWFAQIRLANGAYVKVIDSNNFIKGSLYDLSHELDFRYKKRKRPKFVQDGRRPRNRKEWKELYRYCGEEIKAEYELAEFILAMHKKYDVGITVSSASLASKVFRRHFLKTKIPQIPLHIKPLVEASIHGGRSDVFIQTPSVVPSVRMYDVNSFYPWAMANLPPITKGKWVEVSEFCEEREGFYWITGYVKPCRWPVIIRSYREFNYANDEHVDNVPISSYELREALRSREFILEKTKGYVWNSDNEAVNPFKDYIEEFYALKSQHGDFPAKQIMYKLLLNSLYGKTYQAIRQTSYEETSEWTWNPDTKTCSRNEIRYRAGGIYLPHVGAWITSLCRAKLHQLLHEYEAIDCATDSLKTIQKAKEGKKLGELKLEAEGLLLLIRPKLYVVFSKEVQQEVFDKHNGDLRNYLNQNPKDLDLKRGITKYALHGFWGDINTLLELYVQKENKYIVKHMTKIRESLKQRKQPRIMETRKRQMRVEWKKERQIMSCGLIKKEAMKQKELCNGSCIACAYNTRIF